MAKYIFPDINVRITGYENKLHKLKTNLLEGVALQTGITVVHMMNTVEDISGCNLYSLQSDVHVWKTQWIPLM